MSIHEMRDYIDLCLKGKSTIPERKRILAEKRKNLEDIMMFLFILCIIQIEHDIQVSC